LEQAVQHGIDSICYCCVATGVYGYPQERAAHVALRTVREWYVIAKHVKIVYGNNGGVCTRISGWKATRRKM